MKRFILFVILVALGLLAVSRWNQHRPAPEVFTPAQVSQLHLGDTPALAAIDTETSRLVEAVVPAVVSITTSRKVTTPQIIDPFEFFFGRRRGNPAPQEAIKNSLGSGVIVSKEGHILTNYHVVANVDEVLVQLNDGRAPFPARLVGGDETSDIAVIKIDAKGLRPLPLGDSDTVKVGQLVFAIGNPFGLQETVTKGIISATGRVTDEYGIEYFQTEAVINPGNSGGPLINIRGEIIGINTAIGNYSGSGTWQGVGFAIPSNIARHSMEGILKSGRVARGYLGVTIDPLTPELAEQYGLPTDQGGVMVRSITPGSPAQKAGLQAGDVLVAINGRAIKGARDLVRQISSVAVGSKVEIQTIRDKKAQTFTVTIEEQPAGFKIGPPLQQPQSTAQPPLSQQPQQPKRLPLAAPQLLAGYYIGVTPIPKGLLANYPENVRGVYVESIGDHGEGSLQPGDVIEQINGQPVASPAEFARLAAQLQSANNVLLSIARGKVRSFVVIRVGG